MKRIINEDVEIQRLIDLMEYKVENFGKKFKRPYKPEDFPSNLGISGAIDINGKIKFTPQEKMHLEIKEVSDDILILQRQKRIKKFFVREEIDRYDIVELFPEFADELKRIEEKEEEEREREEEDDY